MHDIYKVTEAQEQRRKFRQNPENKCNLKTGEVSRHGFKLGYFDKKHSKDGNALVSLYPLCDGWEVHSCDLFGKHEYAQFDKLTDARKFYRKQKP